MNKPQLPISLYTIEDNNLSTISLCRKQPYTIQMSLSDSVPRWDLDHIQNPNIISTPRVPMLDYEVEELTWAGGQIGVHALGGAPRVAPKPLTASSPTWEKPRAGGTLESIVNQATRHPHHGKSPAANGDEIVVPWFDGHRAANSAVMTMDGQVPVSTPVGASTAHVLDSGAGTCGGVVCSTGVGSCSGTRDDVAPSGGLARVPVAGEWSSRDQSVSCSGTFVTLDTCEGELGVGGFTSTSPGSPENTTTDDHDSVCHSRPQKRAGDHQEEKQKQKQSGKSTVSNKRSRAAAVHNQSERKRRDKINQRMTTLQKLVPNSSKTDKASMLDEVIEYVKQLQGQIHMMNRVNMSPMMLPMTLQQQLQQQQLQMSMMAPMGMHGMGMSGMPGIGMGMGMGMPGIGIPGMGMPGMGTMDLNAMGRHNMPVIPSGLVNPSAFMHMPSWDGAGAFQSQQTPMNMEAYSKMLVLYQQMHQASAATCPKN